MDIRLEKTGSNSAELTLSIVADDYTQQVDNALKDIRRKSRMPGFRPGQAPLPLLRKLYGQAVTAEQVNTLISEKMAQYLNDNKIDVLGHPLPSLTKHPQEDWVETGNADFVFDLALAPKLDVSLSKDDRITAYAVEASDEMVEGQVRAYANARGQHQQADAYAEGDLLRGNIAELDSNGQPAEEGAKSEGVALMPRFMNDEDEKAKFEGAGKGTAVVFNPHKAYSGNASELASLLRIGREEAEAKTGDFRFEVTEISRFVPAEVNQALFDSVFGQGSCTSEEEFKARIRQGIEAELQEQSDRRFQADLRRHLMARAGKVDYDDALLKRILASASEGKQGQEMSDSEYEQSKESLTWQLMEQRLAEELGVKVEQADVLAMAKSVAKAQLAQYGMLNVPDDDLETYARGMLKEEHATDYMAQRALDMKIAKAAREAVTAEVKSVTAEEFNRLQQDSQAQSDEA